VTFATTGWGKLGNLEAVTRYFDSLGIPAANVQAPMVAALELVRGLLHAESLAAPATQVDEDAVDLDLDAAAFAGRGLLSSAACGVCGRVAIADLERRAREVTADTTLAPEILAGLPAALRAAQPVFDETGGLHGAGLFTTAGVLVAAREDVGRHNAVDKLVGWALDAGVAPAAHVIAVSGRLGYELVQKSVLFGAPIIVAVSAPSSLAIDLAERFGICVAGFVRGTRFNLYAHAWRIR
ncbi:MAG: formate dehydrogenase accessory sulfurtransferase FdhD, partial [Deltaproteobacteria bacterium]|nr:formate dehydrogenase accessory sulfurtransferase FdhD [Deltaproteobacteria bacterium]